MVKQGTWYGGSASVDCSATIIERPRDATQYFNHTRKYLLDAGMLTRLQTLPKRYNSFTHLLQHFYDSRLFLCNTPLVIVSSA